MLPPYSTCHKMWRCHNREPLLEDRSEREAYLDTLFARYWRAREQGVRFHAFSIMPNHAHEVVAIGAHVDPFSSWMRESHGDFGLAYNRRHDRLGKVSCERPKTVPLGDEHAILTVMFYLDANAPKAGLVGSAWEWTWSSHAFYAYGVENRWTKLLDPPQAYLDLGETPEERQAAYLEGYAAYVSSTGREEVGMDEAAHPDGSKGQVDQGEAHAREPHDGTGNREARRASWLARLVPGDPDSLPGFGSTAFVEARATAAREWAREHRRGRAGPRASDSPRGTGEDPPAAQNPTPRPTWRLGV